MPNANNIARLVGGNSPTQGSLVIPSIVPTVTTAFVALNQAGGAAVITPINPSALAAASTAPSFGQNGDGLAFKLRILGKITTGATMNLTVAIQQGNTTTVTAGNTVATTGALAVNTTSVNFKLECECLWDSVSQKVFGTINPSFVGANAIVAAALLTNNPTVTSLATLQFVPVITTSATTGVTISISEFVGDTV